MERLRVELRRFFQPATMMKMIMTIIVIITMKIIMITIMKIIINRFNNEVGNEI